MSLWIEATQVVSSPDGCHPVPIAWHMMFRIAIWLACSAEASTAACCANSQRLNFETSMLRVSIVQCIPGNLSHQGASLCARPPCLGCSVHMSVAQTLCYAVRRRVPLCRLSCQAAAVSGGSAAWRPQVHHMRCAICNYDDSAHRPRSSLAGSGAHQQAPLNGLSMTGSSF